MYFMLDVWRWNVWYFHHSDVLCVWLGWLDGSVDIFCTPPPYSCSSPPYSCPFVILRPSLFLPPPHSELLILALASFLSSSFLLSFFFLLPLHSCILLIPASFSFLHPHHSYPLFIRAPSLFLVPLHSYLLILATSSFLPSSYLSPHSCTPPYSCSSHSCPGTPHSCPLPPVLHTLFLIPATTPHSCPLPSLAVDCCSMGPAGCCYIPTSFWWREWGRKSSTLTPGATCQ